MGMNLGISKTTYGNEDQSWLGSAVGTGDSGPVTLDAAACIAITEFATGTVPSGIPLKRNAGTGRYAPAITAETADAWLLGTTDLTGGGKSVAVNTPTAGMWRGKIIAAKVPAYTGRTSVVAANTNVGQFRLV
jgi:hypothetical protein